MSEAPILTVTSADVEAWKTEFAHLGTEIARQMTRRALLERRIKAATCLFEMLEREAAAAAPAVAPLLSALGAAWAAMEFHRAPLFAHMEHAWRSIDFQEYARRAPTLIFGSSNEAAKSNVPPASEPALHAKIAEIVAEEALPPGLVAQLSLRAQASLAPNAPNAKARGRAPVPREEHVEVKNAARIRDALPTLFAGVGFIMRHDVDDHFGMPSSQSLAALRLLVTEGALVVDKFRPDGCTLTNRWYLPGAESHAAPPIQQAPPAPGPLAVPNDERIGPHKLQRAREMIAEKGYNVTMVAGILDVSKRALYAALYPNGTH